MSAGNKEIPRLELQVSKDDSDQGIRDVIASVRPSWPKDFKYDWLMDGITNRIAKCSHDGEVLLVRIYGEKTEGLINRTKELENFRTLHQYDLSPPLYCLFGNGYVYGYVDGIACDTFHMKEPKVYRGIAAKMAEFHKVPSGTESELFETMHRWLNMIPDEYNTPAQTEQFHKHFDKQQLAEELEELKKLLIPLKSPVVFCHNDILCKNIVWNEATETISFIDYEYGSPNYQGFDIGNHFNEHAGVAAVAELVDYSQYPDKDFQLKFLAQYVSSFEGIPLESVPEDKVLQLYKVVNKFALASHMYWGFWALVQAKTATINFDYLTYGIIRFNEYNKRKDEFVAL